MHTQQLKTPKYDNEKIMRAHNVICSGMDELVFGEYSEQLLRSNINATFYSSSSNIPAKRQSDARLFDFDNASLECYLELLGSNPKIPTIVFSSEKVTPPIAILMMDEYATVVVSKNDIEKDCVEAFRHLFSGQTHRSPKAKESIWIGRLNTIAQDLIPKEAGVLIGYAMDKNPKEIAVDLNISVDTVAKYRSQMKNRYKLRTNGDFAAFLDELQLNRHPLPTSPNNHIQ